MTKATFHFKVFSKNLLIVESPAKAKTIEAILGKDFEVKSCFGHIRDLEKNDMGIDIANNFQPKYIISPEKTKVVSEYDQSNFSLRSLFQELLQWFLPLPETPLLTDF